MIQAIKSNFNVKFRSGQSSAPPTSRAETVEKAIFGSPIMQELGDTFGPRMESPYYYQFADNTKPVYLTPIGNVVIFSETKDVNNSWKGAIKLGFDKFEGEKTQWKPQSIFLRNMDENLDATRDYFKAFCDVSA